MAGGAITSHPGRITINTGTFTDSDCIEEKDLIKNQVKRPELRQLMEYANRRALCTLISSGGVGPYGIDNTKKTQIQDAITKGKSIGNNGYQFPVMGRIEKASVILEQVGGTSADGRFTLLHKDRHLYDGMNVVFNGNRFQARVDGTPQGTTGGYLVNYMSVSGDLFDWTTHVSLQAGTKTCMGAYSSYTERSIKSESRSKFSDLFINHTTIQRKTVTITGTAASQVLWYTFTASDGSSDKGWMYQEVQQGQAVLAMEDERAKWFGVSSMKNADGTYRDIPITNNEGKSLIQGDGVEEQLSAGSVIDGSGTTGEWTYTDIKEMMKALEKKSDKLYGLNWVIVTGTDGFANFQEQAKQYGVQQAIQFHTNVTDNTAGVGGPMVDVGYNWAKMNVAGNSITCIKHPGFDDELMWTERGDDGNILMSSMAFVLNLGAGQNKNIEVMHKSANGVNRANVTATLNGMTGSSEMTISEEDALKYAFLKEDLIVIYNTQECGIMRKRF